MTSPVPGWYPDPFAAEHGTERYWDGQLWSTHTRPVGGAPEPARTAVQPAPGAVGGAAADPSGVEAASWGARLGAALLDVIPFVVLMFVLLGFTDYDELAGRAAQGDEAAFAEAQAMLTAGSPTALMLSLVGVVAQAAYNVLLHASTGQTLGKRMVGIRVVRADDPARTPSIASALLRWIVQYGGPQALSNLPLVGLIAFVFTVVDHLFPLWDARRQALHDKAAKTLVVRVRR